MGNWSGNGGLLAKRNGTQRRTNCMYCGILKGTCLAEVTLNSEKIKPV